MEPNEKFAQWAALFVDAMNNSAASAEMAGQPAPAAVVHYTGVSSDACDLLQAVDAGGVPAFVTSAIMEIAKDNGVDAADHWTPNEIVEAIRSKAVVVPTSTPD